MEIGRRGVVSLFLVNPEVSLGIFQVYEFNGF